MSWSNTKFSKLTSQEQYWQTVGRITNGILGFKGLSGQKSVTLGLCAPQNQGTDFVMIRFCFVHCIGMKNFKATAISTAFRARAPANLSPTHLKSSSGQRNSHPAAMLKRACFILECTVHMLTCASRCTLVTPCSLFSITHSAKYWHDKLFLFKMKISGFDHSVYRSLGF